MHATLPAVHLVPSLSEAAKKGKTKAKRLTLAEFNAGATTSSSSTGAFRAAGRAPQGDKELLAMLPTSSRGLERTDADGAGGPGFRGYADEGGRGA